MSVVRAVARAAASLLLLASACAPNAAHPQTDATAKVPGASSLGMGRPDLLGINIDPTNDKANPGADDLAALGATRVRIELKVPYDASLSDDDELGAALATYDAAVTRLGATKVLFVLDYETLDQQRAGAWTSDGFREAFRIRAGTIAAHYVPFGVDHFEIWNEEDLCAGDYCPRLEPAVYGPLLADATDAIHDMSVNARVALGGLGSGDWESYLGDVQAAMGDRWGALDAIGVHPYTHWPKASGRGPNELEYMLGRCADIAQRPLWLTEWGDGGDQLAAIQAYFAFFADPSGPESGDVGEAYLFAWSDAQHDAPDAFGLFDRDGNKKDAEWSAFHEAAAASAGDTTGVTCGDLGAASGWTSPQCEWNGNGACGGTGAPTSDCDHCCDAGP